MRFLGLGQSGHFDHINRMIDTINHDNIKQRLCILFYIFSKFELLDDYDHPPPIPRDLLIQHSLQANQGYVIIGTKQSGQNKIKFFLAKRIFLMGNAIYEKFIEKNYFWIFFNRKFLTFNHVTLIKTTQL